VEVRLTVFPASGVDHFVEAPPVRARGRNEGNFSSTVPPRRLAIWPSRSHLDILRPMDLRQFTYAGRLPK
jgi:hypothetical protein